MDIASTEQDRAAARWKSRYLDALDAHERLERDAADRVGELAALLVRLSRALPEPQAGPLSKRVARIGDTLRTRPLEPRLSRELRETGEQVLAAMEAGECERAALLGALERVSRQIEAACGSRALRRRLKAFRATLSSRTGPAASELVNDLAQVQEAVLGARSGGGDVGDSSSALDAAAGTSPERSQPAPSGARRDDGPPGPPSVRGADWHAAREVLASLVARVDVPAQFREQAGRVARDLDAGLDDDRLVAVLEAVRDLIDAALASMNSEFRGFLDRVDRRLDTLLAALGQAREDGSAALAMERGLADSFQASLAAMRGDAAQATALDDLKTSIDSHLDCLVSSVQEFRERGEALGSGRNSRLEAMARRLRELESESREARGQLEAQRRLARTDALTGLANRQALDERLAGEVALAREHGTPLAIALADIDHFKRVNDGYGHQAGDRALALFAAVVSRRIRQSDFCARYGGEEFLIVFPGTAAAAAAGAAEQLRRFVESCGFSYRGEPVPLTASFGVTGLAPDDTVETVLERADRALYAAKSEGRNRICCG